MHAGLSLLLFLFCDLRELMRIVIRTLAARAALRNSLGAFHHQRLTHGAERAGRLCFDGVLTFWIIRAAPEDTKAPFALDHVAFLADGADYTARNDWVQIYIFLDEFTFRIARAGDEASKLSFALDEVALLALRALFTRRFRSLDLFAVDTA